MDSTGTAASAGTRARAAATTARVQSGSTETSNGSSAPSLGQSSSTRPSRTRRWNPSGKMSIGIDAGSTSVGTVTAT